MLCRKKQSDNVMKKILKGLLLIVLTALIASCSIMDDDEVKTSDDIVNVGSQLPTFTVIMHGGTVLSNDSLRGKPSLIVFFSTTCPDCQRELPLLNGRYLAHGSDTTFVAISREQTDGVVAAYWKEHGMSMPFSAQPDRKVYSLFAKKGIPRIYISDADCRVVFQKCYSTSGI